MKRRTYSDRFASVLADALSSMACFWIILGLCLLPLIWCRPESLLAWVQYLLQSVFQAVALPVLAFVAKKESIKQARMTAREYHLVEHIAQLEDDAHGTHPA